MPSYYLKQHNPTDYQQQLSNKKVASYTMDRSEDSIDNSLTPSESPQKVHVFSQRDSRRMCRDPPGIVASDSCSVTSPATRTARNTHVMAATKNKTKESIGTTITTTKKKNGSHENVCQIKRGLRGMKTATAPRPRHHERQRFPRAKFGHHAMSVVTPQMSDRDHGEDPITTTSNLYRLDNNDDDEDDDHAHEDASASTNFENSNIAQPASTPEAEPVPVRLEEIPRLTTEQQSPLLEATLVTSVIGDIGEIIIAQRDKGALLEGCIPGPLSGKIICALMVVCLTTIAVTGIVCGSGFCKPTMGGQQELTPTSTSPTALSATKPTAAPTITLASPMNTTTNSPSPVPPLPIAASSASDPDTSLVPVFSLSLLGNTISVEDTKIFFWNDGLAGTLPTEIGYTTYLTELSLGWNMITGTIPSEVGLLTGLTQLILRGNQLSGTLPAELGLLTQLTWLNIATSFLEPFH